MQKIKHWVKNHRKTTIGMAIVLVLVIGMGIINKIKQNKAARSSRYVVAKVAKTTPLTLTGTVAAQQQQVLSLPSPARCSRSGLPTDKRSVRAILW